jgi:hypothetical protein
MRLLGIRFRHAVIFWKNRMDGSFAFFRETMMEKMGIEPWIARMGSVARCGGKSIEASK